MADLGPRRDRKAGRNEAIGALKKISDSHIDLLKAQQAIRDSAAFAFGSACVEFEMEKAKLALLDGQNKVLRYGAVCFELDGHRDRCMKIIVRSMARQKTIGDAALRCAEIDPNSATFTIDLAAGAVLVLNGQEWGPA